MGFNFDIYRMLQLIVTDIRWETADTATFFLAEKTGRKIDYKAGQFLTLIFTHHDEEVRRSYSLSSSPDEELLSITVKRVSNGEISRFLLTKIKVGDVLNAMAPAGRFVLRDFEGEKDLFFFAAGSGIAPIFAQVKFILGRPGKSRLTLIYSSLTRSSIIYKKQLDGLAAQHPERLTITHLISDEANRLNNAKVEQLVSEVNKADFYLCGPFAYMRMVRLTLLYMGVDANNIRKENFVLETVPVTGSLVNFPPQHVRILFGGEWHDVPVGENQSILQAALQNHIPLPYSCRGGVCSTCVARCSGGRVVMAMNDVLTEADLADGLILTCTGHPVTDDVKIEF